jgi:hypothetical protein
LIGLIVIPQILWALDAVNVPLSFVSTGLVSAIFITAAIAITLVQHRRTPPTGRRMPMPDVMLPSHRALFYFLLLLIIARCLTLGLEVLWRPLFPWDATMHWATKARVWFEYRSLVPFVDNDTWLQMSGQGVFTDRHPNYPHTIPLLQVWMNLATGRWDESLMNLPWLVCLIALGTAFYGQLRIAGVNPLISIAFCYLLISMPLVNIHVALAGYADLFLGAVYCAGLMAFHNWVTTRCRAQGLMAIVFALSCTLIKNEGIPWALTFVAALMVVVANRRMFFKLGVLFSASIVLLITLIVQDLNSIDYLLSYVTEFNLDGLLGIVQAIWLHDNLHLLGYLLIAIIPLSLTIPRAFTQTYLGISIALLCAVAMFLFLFMFTVYGAGAANFTGVARLCIQLAPGLLFLCALLSNELIQRAKSDHPAAFPVAISEDAEHHPTRQ